VDGGRKKKKKRRINCLTMMVFFSHLSERLDQKALKRERARAQLGAETEEERKRESERERERERSFCSKKAHSIYSVVRASSLFFWVRTNQKNNKKTKKKADVSS